MNKEMKATLLTGLQEAGKILMSAFGKSTRYEIKESQSSIVTQTDRDSENAIIRIIENAFPDHTIVAEESGFRGKRSEYAWIIDPLDGTSNFSTGIPWFGVLICILKNSEPLMAGVYLPFYDLLYFAEKGKGATRNGISISVSKEGNLKNVLLAYSLDYSADPSKTDRESRIISSLVKKIRNLRSTNSLVDFCYTADGRLGGCVNQTTGIWDIAAPCLIIKEAGGVVTDCEGGEIDFQVNEKNYQKNFTIACSNKTLHPEIMKIIKGIS